jgi:hypothetical protein
MRKTVSQTPRRVLVGNLPAANAARRESCYLRLLVRDGLEFEIPKAMALYLLNGSDKGERLEASSRENPLTSYSGISRVWKQARA